MIIDKGKRQGEQQDTSGVSYPLLSEQPSHSCRLQISTLHLQGVCVDFGLCFAAWFCSVWRGWSVYIGLA